MKDVPENPMPNFHIVMTLNPITVISDITVKRYPLII